METPLKLGNLKQKKSNQTPLGITQGDIYRVQRQIQTDPVWFIDTFFGVKLWGKQAEALRALCNCNRLAIKSGHGVGKSFLCAAALVWFLYAHYPSIVLSTAPTNRQVESILWAEVRTLCNRTPMALGGELLTTKLKLASNWFAMGFSTIDVNKFQGFHSPNMLLIFDEASGVPDEIWQVAKSVLTGQNAKWLCVGNPLSPASNFYQCFKNDDWHKMTISCYDSPNVKEGRDIYPGMVTSDWIRERRNEWGEQHPLWLSRVLGEFPEEAEDTLFPMSWLEQCVVERYAPPRNCQYYMGLDIARYGDDETVFAILHRRLLSKIIHYQGKDTNVTKREFMVLNNEHKFTRCSIDDIGVGGGLVDELCSDNKYNQLINPFNSSEKSTQPDKFFNKRSEAYWKLREAFKNKQIEIPMDYKDKLFAQLIPIKFEIDTRGRIKVESKDSLKERGFKSPDWADALVMAWDGMGETIEVIPADKFETAEPDWSKPVMAEKLPVIEEEAEGVGHIYSV